MTQSPFSSTFDFLDDNMFTQDKEVSDILGTVAVPDAIITRGNTVIPITPSQPITRVNNLTITIPNRRVPSPAVQNMPFNQLSTWVNETMCDIGRLLEIYFTPQYKSRIGFSYALRTKKLIEIIHSSMPALEPEWVIAIIRKFDNIASSDCIVYSNSMAKAIALFAIESVYNEYNTSGISAYNSQTHFKLLLDKHKFENKNSAVYNTCKIQFETLLHTSNPVALFSSDRIKLITEARKFFIGESIGTILYEVALYLTLFSLVIPYNEDCIQPQNELTTLELSLAIFQFINSRTNNTKFKSGVLQLENSIPSRVKQAQSQVIVSQLNILLKSDGELYDRIPSVYHRNIVYSLFDFGHKESPCKKCGCSRYVKEKKIYCAICN